MAVSLITPHDVKLLHAIEDIIGTKLTEYKVDGEYIINIILVFDNRATENDKLIAALIDRRQRDRHDLDAAIGGETGGRDQAGRDWFLRKKDDQQAKEINLGGRNGLAAGWGGRYGRRESRRR